MNNEFNENQFFSHQEADENDQKKKDKGKKEENKTPDNLSEQKESEKKEQNISNKLDHEFFKQEISRLKNNESTKEYIEGLMQSADKIASVDEKKVVPKDFDDDEIQKFIKNTSKNFYKKIIYSMAVIATVIGGGIALERMTATEERPVKPKIYTYTPETKRKIRLGDSLIGKSVEERRRMFNLAAEKYEYTQSTFTDYFNATSEIDENDPKQKEIYVERFSRAYCLQDAVNNMVEKSQKSDPKNSLLYTMLAKDGKIGGRTYGMLTHAIQTQSGEKTSILNIPPINKLINESRKKINYNDVKNFRNLLFSMEEKDFNDLIENLKSIELKSHNFEIQEYEENSIEKQYEHEFINMLKNEIGENDILRALKTPKEILYRSYNTYENSDFYKTLQRTHATIMSERQKLVEEYHAAKGDKEKMQTTIKKTKVWLEKSLMIIAAFYQGTEWGIRTSEPAKPRSVNTSISCGMYPEILLGSLGWDFKPTASINDPKNEPWTMNTKQQGEYYTGIENKHYVFFSEDKSEMVSRKENFMKKISNKRGIYVIGLGNHMIIMGPKGKPISKAGSLEDIMGAKALTTYEASTNGVDNTSPIYFLYDNKIDQAFITDNIANANLLNDKLIEERLLKNDVSKSENKTRKIMEGFGFSMPKSHKLMAMNE